MHNLNCINIIPADHMETTVRSKHLQWSVTICDKSLRFYMPAVRNTLTNYSSAKICRSMNKKTNF